MSIENRIKKLLTDHPHLRDDRDKILATIMTEDYHLTFDQIEALARLFKPCATVDRMFRKVQRDNPELRGKDWLKRQGMAEEKKKELGYNV